MGDEHRGGVPRQVRGGPGGEEAGSRGFAGWTPTCPIFARNESLARLFWKTGYAGVSG